MPRIHAGTTSRSRTGRSAAGGAASAGRRRSPASGEEATAGAPDGGEFGFDDGDGPARGHAAPAPKAVEDRPAGGGRGKAAGGTRRDKRTAGMRKKKKPTRHALSDTSSDESDAGGRDGRGGRQAATGKGPGGRRRTAARGGSGGRRRTPTHSSPKITLDCLEVDDGARKRGGDGAPAKSGGRASRSGGGGGRRSRGPSFEEYYRKGLGEEADPLDSDSDGNSDAERREDEEMANHEVYLPAGRDGSDAGRAAVPPPRAVGADNRSLPGVAGDGMSRTFLSGLSDLISRGVGSGVLAPSRGEDGCGGGGGGTTVLAALSDGTGQGGAGRGGGPACASSYLFEGLRETPGDSTAGREGARRAWLSDVLRPVRVRRDSRGPSDGSPPAGFSAAETWSVLGDLVTSMADRLVESDHGESSRPHAVTIFTTDAVLFADAEVGSHLAGLDGFWEKIRPAIETNAVDGVEVRVVETTAGLARSGRGPDGEDDMTDGDDGEEGATTRAPDRYGAIAVLNGLRRRIAELNSARRLGGDGDAAPRNEMDVTIEYAEGNHASLLVLHQDWVREAFAASHGPAGTRGRVEFPLPESRHGSGVNVALDVEYALLPTGLRSGRTAALAEDMAGLSSTRFEIVQTLPLSMVDSSLVHGVPMRARPSDGGGGGDAARYSEMRLLVRQLWRCLSRNSVALVLRGTVDGERCGEEEERLFLLAAEQAVEPARAVDEAGEYDAHEARMIVRDEGGSGGGVAAGQGVLYRYATAGQVLRFGDDDGARDEEPEVPPGVEEAVFESIESSLMGLDRTGLNPLLVREGAGL